MTEQQGSATHLARVSRELMEQGAETPTLQAVVDGAVEVVPSSDHASITIRRKRQQMRTVASTSETATRCDQIQYELGEGPCMESVDDSSVHVSRHLDQGARWSRWGPRAAALGPHSVLSIQLSTDAEVIGSLNMYGDAPNGFDRDEVDLALVYTTHATNALVSSRLITGLRTAVDSRHRIGVAQGIVMNAFGLSTEASFELLRRYSSHRNVKLRVLADWVVEHRRLPEDTDLEPGPAAVDPADTE